MGMSTISSKQTSEPRKRLTKVRSVKVVSLERSRSSLKHKKSRLNQKLNINEDMSKQSPNYMRPTSCSNARRRSFKPKSGDESTELRSAKRLLSLKRSRKKFSTRSRLSCDDEASISCIGEEANVQLIKSGSIKLTTRKSLKFQRRQWSSSRFNKASIFRTDEESPQQPSSVQGNETGEGFNSVDAIDVKPLRALWKIPSLRHRRLLIKKQSRILDCSSTISSTNPEVCHYKYCSVHGSVQESRPQLSLLSKKQKSRRWKHKPGDEKVQIQEVAADDLAVTSGKTESDMWNHFLLQKNEEDPSTSAKQEFSQVEAVEFVQQAVDEILILDRQLSNAHQVEDSSAINLSKLPSSKGFKKIRKLIATTKFVKAMEKLRKEHAPRNTFLAHLSADKKKSREEWLFDLVLQQVTSKLDLAQQRRVRMLIDAFESITQDTKIYCNSDHERVEPTESLLETVIGETSNSKELTSQVYSEPRGATDDGIAKGMKKVARKLAEPTMGNQKSVYSCKADGHVGKDVDFHFEKEKFTSVWHQVYHHFVANQATNVKTDAADLKMKSVDDMKHITESGHLEQANAIQLVQEAINELSHLQEQLSGQQLSELHSNLGEEKTFIELKDTHKEEIEMRVSDRQMPSKQQKSKAHHKLRKMGLSPKFISAMEKVRKINPHKSENVSLEEERVYPRHWSMEDKKISDQQMLDCALQEVTTELDPAQKEKVAVLTQAFKICLPEIEQQNKGLIVEKTNLVCDSGSQNITENDQTMSVLIDQDDEFERELHYNNVELTGVNLHIHEMGSPKGCPVCDPREFIMHYKEENEINRENQLEDPTESPKINQVGENSSNENTKKDDMNIKDTELLQNEANKFVEEAVKEILQMPEEKFDDQSIIPEDKSLQEVTGSYKNLSRAKLRKIFVKAMKKRKKQCSEESTPKSIIPKQQKEFEKKNHEVMLDYALQRAIANLDPDQKKKVPMLVQAFERVAQ